MVQRFFAAEHDGKVFIGVSEGKAYSHVTLRDIGTSRVWSGKMHASEAAARTDAEQQVGPFDGEFVAIVELRELTRDEAQDLGTRTSSSPDTYREAFTRTF